MNTVASQNIPWVRSPVTWGMSPGWEDTISSIQIMAPGLVSEGLLIDPPECLNLVLHGLLWEVTNKQGTQGGSFLILLIFFGIIPLLDSLVRYLKDQ